MGKFTERGAMALFFQLLREATQQSYINDIMGPILPSTQAVEAYVGGGTVAPMSKTVESANVDQLVPYEMLLRNIEYSTNAEIPGTTWRYASKSGNITALNEYIGSLADREVQHWEDLLVQLLLANGNAHDGVAFFNSSHPLKKAAGVNDNLHDSAAASGTTPTPLEAATALLNTANQFRRMKDEHGRDMVRSRQFVVLVPTTIAAALEQAVSQDNLATAASAVVDNPIRPMRNSFEIVASNLLDTGLNGVAGVTDRFYMFAKGERMKPFVRQEENVDRFILGPESEQYKLSKKVVMGTTANRAAGYHGYQLAHCHVFT